MYVARIFLTLSIPLLALANGAFAQSGNGALVTVATGSLTREGADGIHHIDAFLRLREGDHVALERNARLRLVYFSNGRQETWSGAGQLTIGGDASKSKGELEAQVVQLPDVLTRQLAKTPGPEGQARAGMTRLRALPSGDQTNQAEATYRQLRSRTSGDDLNPEMYLFARLFELRELDRLELAMRDLQSRRTDAEAKALLGHYQKALGEARSATEAKPGG